MNLYLLTYLLTYLSKPNSFSACADSSAGLLKSHTHCGNTQKKTFPIAIHIWLRIPFHFQLPLSPLTPSSSRSGYSVVISRPYGLKTRVHSSSFCPVLGNWSRDLMVKVSRPWRLDQVSVSVFSIPRILVSRQHAWCLYACSTTAVICCNL